MKSLFAIIVGTTILLSSSSHATSLSNADREMLVHAKSADITILHSMRDFPPSVMKAWNACDPQMDRRIAEPGEPFEATDSLSGKNLPPRQLFWGAHVSHFYVMHFELGGYASSLPFLVFDDAKGDAQVVLTGVAWRIPFKDYAEFAAKLANPKLNGNNCHGL